MCHVHPYLAVPVGGRSDLHLPTPAAGKLGPCAAQVLSLSLTWGFSPVAEAVSSPPREFPPWSPLHPSALKMHLPSGLLPWGWGAPSAAFHIPPKSWSQGSLGKPVHGCMTSNLLLLHPHRIQGSS